MQTTTAQYDALVSGDLRPLAWAFFAAFDKVFNFDVEFFTLDTSTLDGGDILAPDGSNVIAEWDKYQYQDYSDRVMQIEWQREEEVPYSVTQAIADVVLKNEDNFFTYGNPALAESYFDNFDEGFNSLWNVWGGSSVIVSGGELEITVGPLEGYKGMNSIYAYDLSSSFYSVEVVDAGNQSSANYECIPLELVNVLDRNDKLKLSIEQDVIYCFKTINTVTTQVASLAYNSAVHKFFRIREASGTTYWEYSTNATSWTSIHSESNPITVTALEIDIVAGYFNDDVAPSTAIFDNFNTNGSGVQLGSQVISPISSYNLPRRPIRLLGGFANSRLPQFVGLTDSTPKVDRQARTATLHAEDFLSFIFNKPLDQAVMLENVKTDVVLEELFTLVGLSANQYVLDEAYNEIAFLYFERGKKLGDAIRELMQAELGNLYMDEFGIIQFRNRVRQTDTPVQSFDSSTIVDYELSDDSKIINLVEVKADVREVQPLQEVFSLAAPIPLPTGSTEVFFNFDDPVTTLDTIDDYTANTAEDESGSDITGDVSVTDTDLFANAVKVTFDNSGASGFLTALNLFGTPAKVVKSIYLKAQDDDSIDQFEEQPIVIENNFIQSDDAANSLALSLINYYKDYASTIELEVKGNFALQVGDTIHVTIDNIDSDFNITKLINTLEPTRFRQIIHARVYNIPAFFVLDESELDSSDVLSP